MASIFTRIINDEIPCYKIAENDKFLSFLDITPIAEGHTLVVPKVEIDYIFDLDDNTLAEMMIFAKKVAAQIKSKFNCNRVAVVVYGLEVPHAHIHLIPMNKESDADFNSPRLSLSKERFEEIKDMIQIL